MPTDKFSSSWINLREPYDSISRSSLLLDLYRKDANPFNNIIDLGGGNGSFLRWCHSQSINYNKFMIIEKAINDARLDKSDIDLSDAFTPKLILGASNNGMF